MTTAVAHLERPTLLSATHPPETEGKQRDEVKLLASDSEGDRPLGFRALPRLLTAGDLLVVNRSATIPASIPARWEGESVRCNLCTRFGDGMWLAEPRRGVREQGPLGIDRGERITLGSGTAEATMVASYPHNERLTFFSITGSIEKVLARDGEPIRYDYVDDTYHLSHYQTIFGDVPGSVEMPSAGRPFSDRVIRKLRVRGVGIAPITLHTGVSSLETTSSSVKTALVPERYHVPSLTAQVVNATKARGGRVIAAGTTVVRALESAWDGTSVTESKGITRLAITHPSAVNVVDGLLTGFHEPTASHLAMVGSFIAEDRLRDAYERAIEHGFRWHEFGDVHLILDR